jgi:hypothetical protein
MKIFLGERPGHVTGAGEECIEAWKDTRPFVLDTGRLTPVRFRIEDEDVTGLFYALIARYRKDGQHSQIIKICSEVLLHQAPACQQAAAGIEKRSPDT